MESNCKSAAIKLHCECSLFSLEGHISQQAFYKKRKQKWPTNTQKCAPHLWLKKCKSTKQGDIIL